MKRIRTVIGCLLVALWFLGSSSASALDIEYHVQGATLANAPDYSYWYGCAPTAAGMMMGYYDINGYGGLTYDNLVPGGTAELSNYGNPGALANNAIASSGHIADFWTGYGNSGDDPLALNHEFDSLADFMGTSQDSVGNPDGNTMFWNYTDGSRLYAWELPGYGIQDLSGMYGMWEYFTYAGYGDSDSQYDFFNQYIDTPGLTYGFTFEDYMDEIDAGRVVMIHVSGHSMFGYGYDETTNNVYLHDTFYEGENSMEWGGSYYGLDMYGVTCFTPSGGEAPAPVPEPATMLLLGSGLAGLVGFRRKLRKS